MTAEFSGFSSTREALNKALARPVAPIQLITLSLLLPQRVIMLRLLMTPSSVIRPSFLLFPRLFVEAARRFQFSPVSIMNDFPFSGTIQRGKVASRRISIPPLLSFHLSLLSAEGN